MKNDSTQNRPSSIHWMAFLAILISSGWLLRTCSTTVPTDLDTTDLPTVSIADLRSHISEWDHKPVVIEGRVVYTWYSSFPDGGFYTIDDGTGQISVMKQGLTPEQGLWIRVAVEPKALARIGVNTGVAAAEIQVIASGDFPRDKYNS